MPPTAAADTASMSEELDEFDDLTEMESADEILARQIALGATSIEVVKSTRSKHQAHKVMEV